MSLIPDKRGADRDLAIFLWFVIGVIVLLTVILLLAAGEG